MSQNIQIVLAIGNSRYHWAWFLDTQLQFSWDTAHLVVNSIANSDYLDLLPTNLHQEIGARQIAFFQVPIYLCSVVPSQTAMWQQLPQVQQISLADIPLLNLYPTLGIDRALSLLGAGEVYGYPVLVIDGGTALTITGVDNLRTLVGGAIMPGLKLQLSSLASGTAALPEILLPVQLPHRWSDNTPDAIASGILHTISVGISDFIGDWLRLFPASQIIFTGGDGDVLAGYVKSILPTHLVDRVQFDRQLIFHGCAVILR